MNLKKKQPEILFEDDDLLVINKPPMLLTVPDRYAPEKPNLYAWLAQKIEKPYIVHRLDKETSGVIVFAKNAEAHRRLSMDFEHRRVQKTYLAILEGSMYEEEGEIDKPLAQSKTKYNRMVIHERGKPSKTSYKVVERFRNYTLIEAAIHTGRLHQIRVHLASIGYPLAVDFLYGNHDEFKLSAIKKKRMNLGKFEEERPLISRATLHAYRLILTHPKTGEVMEFKASPPKDFRAMLNQLRKWNPKD